MRVSAIHSTALPPPQPIPEVTLSVQERGPIPGKGQQGPRRRVTDINPNLRGSGFGGGKIII